MLGLSVIILFNLIYNVNSNLAESSANCSDMTWPEKDSDKDKECVKSYDITIENILT